MSKQTLTTDRQARVPLFLFLLGTLAFSLSTLPLHESVSPPFLQNLRIRTAKPW